MAMVGRHMEWWPIVLHRVIVRRRSSPSVVSQASLGRVRLSNFFDGVAYVSNVQHRIVRFSFSSLLPPTLSARIFE